MKCEWNGNSEIWGEAVVIHHAVIQCSFLLQSIRRFCMVIFAIKPDKDFSFDVSPGLFHISENKEAPLVERTPSENWKWIGEGHDSKSELNAEWHRIMPALRGLYY